MPEGLAIVRQDGFGNRTFFRLVDVPVFPIGRHLLVPRALGSAGLFARPSPSGDKRLRAG